MKDYGKLPQADKSQSHGVLILIRWVLRSLIPDNVCCLAWVEVVIEDLMLGKHLLSQIELGLQHLIVQPHSLGRREERVLALAPQKVILLLQLLNFMALSLP